MLRSMSCRSQQFTAGPDIFHKCMALGAWMNDCLDCLERIGGSQMIPILHIEIRQFVPSSNSWTFGARMWISSWWTTKTSYFSICRVHFTNWLIDPGYGRPSKGLFVFPKYALPILAFLSIIPFQLFKSVLSSLHMSSQPALTPMLGHSRQQCCYHNVLIFWLHLSRIIHASGDIRPHLPTICPNFPREFVFRKSFISQSASACASRALWAQILK